MKITFKTVAIDELFNKEDGDIEETIEEFGLDETSNPLLLEIFKEMASGINKQFDGIEVAPFENEFLDAARSVEYPLAPNREVEVQIVLYSNPEVASFFGNWGSQNKPLGFHASSSGWELFRGEEIFDNAAHQVFICTDDAPLDQAIEEMIEDRKGNFDRFIIRRDCTNFLITLTHEVCHAIEFIEHGAGLTPQECREVADDAEIPYVSVYHGAREDGTGREGSIPLSDLDDSDEEEWEDLNTEILEDRIEEKGVMMFCDLVDANPRLKALIEQLTDEKTLKFMPQVASGRKPSSMSF